MWGRVLSRRLFVSVRRQWPGYGDRCGNRFGRRRRIWTRRRSIVVLCRDPGIFDGEIRIHRYLTKKKQKITRLKTIFFKNTSKNQTNCSIFQLRGKIDVYFSFIETRMSRSRTSSQKMVDIVQQRFNNRTIEGIL